jgi:hypothetical protein
MTYYSGDKIKKDEKSITCNMHSGEEKYTEGFGRETPRKEITCKNWEWMGKQY